MKESEKSPAELYLENARSSGLMNEENEARFLAVAEMIKHPLTVEQMREQIKRNHAEADKHREMRLYIDIIETDENGKRKEYKEGTHKQILVYGYKKNFSDKRVVAKSEIFKDTGSVSYRNYKWVFDGHKLSKVN